MPVTYYSGGELRMTVPLFSAIDVARILTEPGKQPLIPTPEQQRIIELTPTDAVLVIAGAGSGKTETIANRVVWLVANGFVQPNEILGLTFTRKAAGELADRIRGRLLLFVERAHTARLTSEQHERIDVLGERLQVAFELPEVSTYNSFAVAIVQEFGAMLGLGGELIDDAVAWRLARDVVTASSDARIGTLEMGVARITELVISLEHALRDHLSDVEAAQTALNEFSSVADLPYNQREYDSGVTSGKTYADITRQMGDHEKTRILLQLVDAYTEVKRERGLLEFSDQVALALQVLESHPDALSTIRGRYTTVLLDEVQDTSVAQTVLLSSIFRGSHVMAVGDPHQSIYGWRGASSENLSEFHRSFRAVSEDKPSLTLTLSTSWRNSQMILEAANRVSEPLRVTSPVHVPTLATRPGAPQGSVEARYPETLSEEAATVAAWLADQRGQYLAQGKPLPTAAIILRQRKHMSLFAKALSARGLPSRIIGIGGLLETPEIHELVTTLRVVALPDSTNELIRLLAGPRFSIGVADLAGLRDTARWLRGRNYALKRIDPESLAVRGSLDHPHQHVSLLDALDLIPSLPAGHRAVATLSEEGHSRLGEAAYMLRKLRTKLEGHPLDLIRATIEELRLDIELESQERFLSGTSSTARENIQAFAEAVRGFLRISETSDLSEVLNWLERSSVTDPLPAYVPPPEPGTVHIITVHSSKGLEWDLVAVPRQSIGSFPTLPRSTRGALAVGVIPDECRGDQASRPRLLLDTCRTQQEVKEAMTEYQNGQRKIHDEEELRLIYVAYTRAKESLLLTGSFWDQKQSPSSPSAPLKALSGVYEAPYLEPQFNMTPLIDPLPKSTELSEKPESLDESSLEWPQDPLGSRRAQVEAAAELVRRHRSHAVLSAEGALLLEESRQRDDRIDLTSLFQRINASSFHEFIRNPEEALHQLLRPVPQQPFQRTRIGNLFHEWVEARTTTHHGTAVALELDSGEAAITDTELRELAELQATFESSPWAIRQPIDVELQITIPFANRRVVCKLDAVFEHDGQYEIVDWKTGRPPKNDEERAERFLQLDLYRVAYALHQQVPPEKITATLFYIDHNEILTNPKPASYETLQTLWLEAFQKLTEKYGPRPTTGA